MLYYQAGDRRVAFRPDDTCVQGLLGDLLHNGLKMRRCVIDEK